MPPTGPRDEQRYEKLSSEDQAQLRFEVRFYDRILERRPEYVEAMRLLASAYTHLGYYEDGLALDMRICRILPENAGARYDLACSLALTGRTREALDALETACTLGWNDRLHMAQDPDLESLHDTPRFAEIIRRIQPPSQWA